MGIFLDPGQLYWKQNNSQAPNIHHSYNSQTFRTYTPTSIRAS